MALSLIQLQPRCKGFAVKYRICAPLAL